MIPMIGYTQIMVRLATICGNQEKNMTEPELLRCFDQALTNIAQLAEAIGEQHWKQAFFDWAL